MEGSGVQTLLVCLHGFPLDGRVWRAVAGSAPDWPAGVTIACIDLPGFGQRSAEPPAETVSAMAAAVVAEIARLRGTMNSNGRVVLAGLSMGGYVAGELLRLHQTAVHGLVLVDTKMTADDEAQRAHRDRMIELAHSGRKVEIVQAMLPRMTATDFAQANPSAHGLLVEMMHAVPGPTMAAALAAMRDRPDQTETFRAATIPVLAVVGEHDAITPPACAHEVVKANPLAAMAVIPGAGHMAPLERPSEIRAAIASWLVATQAGGR